MPLAIIDSNSPSGVQVIYRKTDRELLAALAELEPGIELRKAEEAALWLLGRPYPSGWYASVAEARARLQQDASRQEMSAEELAAIRHELSLSRAAFAEAMGFVGTPNTRHKQVWEMERGRKAILPERARSARTLQVLGRLAAIAA